MVQDVARQPVQLRGARARHRLAQRGRYDGARAVVPLVPVPVADGARKGAAGAVERRRDAPPVAEDGRVPPAAVEAAGVVLVQPAEARCGRSV